MKTIISIDTGNPSLEQSTSAVVRMDFDGKKIKRSAIVYSGSYMNERSRITRLCADADYIVIEKIDATNKYIAREVIAEQLALMNMLTTAGMTVHELVRSGRKEVITDDLMKQIELWKEGPHKTNHNDVREATRNGLYFMAKDEELNETLSEYVQHFFQ